MAAKSELELTFGYTDESTRKFKVGKFAPSATTGFKANIKSFNANDVDDIKDKLLSDDGASCTGIVAATIFTEEITDINLND